MILQASTGDKCSLCSSTTQHRLECTTPKGCLRVIVPSEMLTTDKHVWYRPLSSHRRKLGLEGTSVGSLIQFMNDGDAWVFSLQEGLGGAAVS